MPPGSVHLLVGSMGGGQRERGGGRMGVEGGSVLIPSRAQILEKLMRHVYFKQYFTCDEFKKGKHQISSYLALLKNLHIKY